MEKEGAGLGKRVGGALYVHRSALDHLPPKNAALIDAAASHMPQGNWNVAKIDLADGSAVLLLSYDDFADSAFPVLNESKRLV